MSEAEWLEKAKDGSGARPYLAYEYAVRHGDVWYQVATNGYVLHAVPFDVPSPSAGYIMAFHDRIRPKMTSDELDAMSPAQLRTWNLWTANEGLLRMFELFECHAPFVEVDPDGLIWAALAAMQGGQPPPLMDDPLIELTFRPYDVFASWKTGIGFDWTTFGVIDGTELSERSDSWNARLLYNAVAPWFGSKSLKIATNAQRQYLFGELGQRLAVVMPVGRRSGPWRARTPEEVGAEGVKA